MSSINGLSTVPGLLRNVVSHVHPETSTFLLQKVKDNWEEISYKQVLDHADAISSYLKKIQFDPAKDESNVTVQFNFNIN